VRTWGNRSIPMQYLTGLLSCSSNSSFHPDQSEPISTKQLGSLWKRL